MPEKTRAARRGNAGAAQRQRHDEGVQLAQDSRASNAGINEAGAKRLRHGERFAALHPSGRYAFVDKLQFWTKTPLAPNQIATLQSQCGGKVYAANERARFGGRFVQRVQMCQPQPEALAWVNSSEGLRINYAEIALDFVFDSEEELQAAHDLICRLHWKRHHGKQQVTFVEDSTRYSGQRKAANVLVTYADKPCRITGEVFCLHIEWRMRGKSLRKKSLSEIIEEGPRTFWQSRLIFREIDFNRLGHLSLNRQHGSNRREPRQTVSRGGFVYDVDRATGCIMVHALGRSTQSVLDGFKLAEAGRFSTLLSVDHLLPSADQGWEGHSYDYVANHTLHHLTH